MLSSFLVFCFVIISPVSPEAREGAILNKKKSQLPVYKDTVKKIAGKPTKLNKEATNANLLFSFIHYLSLLVCYYFGCNIYNSYLLLQQRLLFYNHTLLLYTFWFCFHFKHRYY